MKKIDKYLNDPDTMKVAFNAAKSFTKYLSKDEIQSCVYNAILRASNKYDKRNKTKFTSYLHNGVVYECLSQRKFNLNKSTQRLTTCTPDRRNPIAEIDMLDFIQAKCDEPDLILDRFYNNMSIKEIAESRGVCGEAIRIRLKKNQEKLRVALANCV